MRHVAKILEVKTVDLENTKYVYRITLEVRLNISYEYYRKITTYSKKLITTDFLCVRHGKSWMTFAHQSFSKNFVNKLAQRYPSMTEGVLENAVRLTQDYNSKKLKVYARELHPSLLDAEIGIFFEDITLPEINGLHYAIPTAINLLISDPTGRRSAITEALSNL